MPKLTIASDWLPIDQWLDDSRGSTSGSTIEEDLIDCVIYWSTKHSQKGSSSHDALAKSLEAVRILVSFGIERLPEAATRSATQLRVRELFRTPFAELKALRRSPDDIDSILSINSGGDKKRRDLFRYWDAEDKNRINSRLYAMALGNFEDALAEARILNEISDAVKPLSKLIGIPLGGDRDAGGVGGEILIRTLFAMHLAGVKRPTKKRAEQEKRREPLFNDFEGFQEKELVRVKELLFLHDDKQLCINNTFKSLIETLSLSNNAFSWIFGKKFVSWTEYISGLWSEAEEQAKKKREEAANEENNREKTGPCDPLSLFAMNFLCDEMGSDIEAFENEDVKEGLENLFDDPKSRKSCRELAQRAEMRISDVASLLAKGVKLGLLDVTKEGNKKLYGLRHN